MAHREATTATYNLDVIRSKEFQINHLKRGLRQSDEALAVLHEELKPTNAIIEVLDRQRAGHTTGYETNAALHFRQI